MNKWLTASLCFIVCALSIKLYLVDKEFSSYKVTQAIEAQNQMKESINNFIKVQNELVKTNNITLEKVNQIEKTTDASITAINNGNARMYAISKELSETASDYSKTNGLGNATSIELPRDVGRNILTIKQGIEQDRAKILYLQDYIRKIDKMLEEAN